MKKILYFCSVKFILLYIELKFFYLKRISHEVYQRTSD